MYMYNADMQNICISGINYSVLLIKNRTLSFLLDCSENCYSLWNGKGYHAPKKVPIKSTLCDKFLVLARKTDAFCVEKAQSC